MKPTTKLDGFTAVYSEFLLTASDHIPNDGKMVVGGIGEVTGICAAFLCAGGAGA